MNIATGLENVLGLNTNAGSAEMQQAIAALQAVGVPNAAQLTLPELQKYVAAGVLSPQQYQAISADPQAYQQAWQQASDMSGKNAQSAALQQLGNIVQSGGSTSINQANLLNNVQQTNQAMQAARQGISENAQERGVAGGGLEYINKLMNEQSNANTANTGAVNAAANNAQLALQALSGQGQLGGQMQGASDARAQAQAQAAQQIAEYNSQLQSAANQYNTQNANQAQQMNLANAQQIGNANTGNANMRTQYNAQVPQQIFSDQMQKAGAVSGGLQGLAGLKQQQAGQQNAFIGNLIGAGATMGGDYMAGSSTGNSPKSINNYGSDVNSSAYKRNSDMMNPYNQPYAHGGEVEHMEEGGNVPGEPNVPGDSAQNDTVPAMLSPHEIVLPRTVTQAPNAPDAAAQFVGAIKGQQPKAFADVIKELEDNGLEIRLCPKGY